MALDKITSDSLATGAVNVSALPDGVVSAVKLHTTAISDKLGYTPVSPTDLSSGLALKANTSSLSTVATSGSYNDLSGIPTLGSLAALSSISTNQITDGVVTGQKLASNAVFLTQFNARTSQHSLGGDSGWVDHLSMSFTTGRACNCLFIYSSSSSYESGAVQGFARLMLDGVQVGYNSAVARQSASNHAGSGTCFWDKQNVSAGTHTITVQVRNTVGGTTWITPYFSADGNTANTIGVLYYGG